MYTADCHGELVFQEGMCVVVATTEEPIPMPVHSFIAHHITLLCMVIRTVMSDTQSYNCMFGD